MSDDTITFEFTVEVEPEDEAELEEMLAFVEEYGDRLFEPASIASIMDALSERRGDEGIAYWMAIDLPDGRSRSEDGPAADR